MDHDEMEAAVKRATMDQQTARDYIVDLQKERIMLYEQIRYLEAQIRQLEVERDGWIRQAIGRD